MAFTCARLPLECNPAVRREPYKRSLRLTGGSSLHHMLHGMHYPTSEISARTHRGDVRAICFSKLNSYVKSTARNYGMTERPELPCVASTDMDRRAPGTPRFPDELRLCHCIRLSLPPDRRLSTLHRRPACTGCPGKCAPYEHFYSICKYLPTGPHTLYIHLWDCVESPGPGMKSGTALRLG